MLYYERKLIKKGYNLIIGVDEVGRGPLAGPVAAAAVTLKTVRFKNRIDDSKKLSRNQREQAFGEIVNKSVFGIGLVNERIIDRVNIAVATRMAMEQAISGLLNKLGDYHSKRIHILVDGNMHPQVGLPHTSIIKGDSKSKSIACASIVAKVIRDRIMDFYDKLYPQYGFIRHKGYLTQEHRSALKKFGPSSIHRLSFNGV